MKRTRFELLFVLALAWATCGGKGSGPQSVLPGSNKVESWELTQGPLRIDDEAGLYNRIDGGAPKYIERGWVSSTFAEYRKGDRSLQVAVHDMGTPSSAETIFRMYLPAARIEVSSTSDSDPEGPRTNGVVNINLSSTYAAYAFGNRYYMEANIDAKTDAALADLKAFVLELIDRAR